MAVTGVSNYNSVYENTYATSRKEATKKEEMLRKSNEEANASLIKNN
ncbi:MAG: hypothetical protein HDR02_15820 [Lachnospiraceae bacterium]|nr:hypothetical protein [Lachnospiraceae bacterium]